MARLFFTPQETVAKELYSGSGMRVPSDFVGMHFHQWPSGTTEAPSYRFGSVRTHDYRGALGYVTWAAMNPSLGVYNFNGMDAFIAAHGDRSICYTLYQTPTWAASNTTKNDPYGILGGSSPPSSIDADGLYEHLRLFLGVFLARYGSKLKWIECWNEPKWPGTHPTFWAGTAAQMAKIARTVREVRDEFAPSLKIVSPAFVDVGYSAEFISASDGAAGTLIPQIGAASVDCYSVHFYNANSFASHHQTTIANKIQVFRSELLSAGILDPTILVSEVGWTSAATTFWHLSEENQANFIGRGLIHAACNGVTMYAIYGHDNDYSGRPQSSTELSSVINEVHTQLAGKVVVNAVQTSHGAIVVRFSDGTLHRFFG